MSLTIKVCGLTRTQDIDVALEHGADMLGFIHVPKSPRFVDRFQLARLLEHCGGRATRVVVVQNATESALADLRADLDFDWFQFHGCEPDFYTGRYHGYKVVHMPADVSQIPVAPPGPFFLMDTAVGKLSGGAGKTFDWTILPKVPGRFLVAGGLNPDNVADLVGQYQPWGIDVSSGVEAEKGRKDHDKLITFLQRAKAAAAANQEDAP